VNTLLDSCFGLFSQPQKYVDEVQMRQQGSVNGGKAGNGGGDFTLSMFVRRTSDEY